MRFTWPAIRCCTPASRCSAGPASRSVDRTLWLDGLIGALAVAAVGARVPAAGTGQGSTEGDLKTIVVNLAYPLGDVVLLSPGGRPIALSGWRADAALACSPGGLAVMAYRRRDLPSAGGDDRLYVPGSWPDTMWLVGGDRRSPAPHGH